MSPRNYGSVDPSEEEEEEDPQGLALVSSDESWTGTVDRGGGGDEDTAAGADAAGRTAARSWLARQHCVSYALAAAVCLLSARYWGRRAGSYHSGGHPSSPGSRRRRHRVPTPPALSALDPAADLNFRTISRRGLASPSRAWGGHLTGGGGGDGGSSGPLPTNAWYGNLLSHGAASDPSRAGEVAHVYAVPYVVGVSPPGPPRFPSPEPRGRAETMAGIDILLPYMKTSAGNVQMVYLKSNGVSLGAIVDRGTGADVRAPTSYKVDADEELSPLGVSLKWDHVAMRTSIVRGMPYGTMRYGRDPGGRHVLPVITAGSRVRSILVDGEAGSPGTKMLCGSLTGGAVDQDPNRRAAVTSDGRAETHDVRGEVIFQLSQSDFTWVAFFSKPVKVRCFSDAVPAVSAPGTDSEVKFRLDVTAVEDGGSDDELVVRVALLSECSSGRGTIREHCDFLGTLGYDTVSSKSGREGYLSALRKGAGLYSKSPLVGVDLPGDGGEDDEGRMTNVVFDWDATPVNPAGRGGDSGVALGASALRAPSSGGGKVPDDDDFIMFALPHHLEALEKVGGGEVGDDASCFHTFHGRTCLVRGSVWNLPVSHGEPQSFLADRPPAPEAIPSLAEALNEDIKYKLSGNVFRGAADTYFPAKVLAKLGRIVEINEELRGLRSNDDLGYSDADEVMIEESASSAAEVPLPSDSDVTSLLDDLERAVEIWLKPGGREEKGAEAEFLYDTSWGGFINCGCNYTFTKGHEGDGSCYNSYPNCPAVEDVNKDFGNAFYNDHHFHYGYHIYAAAVVAKHRPEWGRKYFQQVLLYIRDIANPSPEDKNFPTFRQKDWYLGNSWAAGLMSMELSPHGREQESSSEAIAAFEGIALYGQAMMDAFGDGESYESARLVRNVGELLTSMEVSAANRFWHVWGSKSAEGGDVSSGSGKIHVNTYPSKYTKPVVGMMYDTMASFQTWFAPQDVVSYGIQLIPFTAVSERRDDPEWTRVLYPVYADACEDANEGQDGRFCEDNGWSIVQAGLLAETGQIKEALDLASNIPDIWNSDGACGNSRTNTIWFISTRKPDDVAVAE